MRSLIVLVLLFATACTSTPRRSQPTGAARPDIIVYPVKREGPSGGDLGWYHLGATGEYETTAIDAPVEEVWKALIRAYPEVGIELGHIDPETGLIGNRQVSLRRTIGGDRASQFLNCGITGTGYPRANEGLLTGRVITYVEAVTEETSRMHTLVELTVQMQDGNSSNRQPCSSRGALEERLHRLVELDLLVES